VLSLGLDLVGLIISVFTGVFSGFAPAWQASKIGIGVPALRMNVFLIWNFDFDYPSLP